MASALAKQIHSIDIGRKSTDGGLWTSLKNTWDDYHLVPSTRPVVNPPEPKTNYVDIPGIDGVLDMSTALTGTMLYKNREGSWDFVVANDYEPWEVIFHKLKNDLHGKRFDVRLMDEPYYYYKGRLSVNEWKSEQNWSKVTLDYYFQPYKFEINSGNEPWLWDPFSFKTGIIRNYGYASSPLTTSTSVPLSLWIASTERIQSLIIYVVSGTGLKVRVGGGSREYDLSSGRNDLTDFIVSEQDYTGDITHAYIGPDGRQLDFIGDGSVYVEFQGGWL